jgi:hypothetical protein
VAATAAHAWGVRTEKATNCTDLLPASVRDRVPLDSSAFRDRVLVSAFVSSPESDARVGTKAPRRVRLIQWGFGAVRGQNRARFF